MSRANKIPRSTDSRLSIRVDDVRKAVIARAASSQGTSINQFVLDSAYQLANELLLDDGHLRLTAEQVAFMYATAEKPPPANVAAVRKLLSEPSILDG